jgi:hypothetical protein
MSGALVCCELFLKTSNAELRNAADEAAVRGIACF